MELWLKNFSVNKIDLSIDRKDNRVQRYYIKHQIKKIYPILQKIPTFAVNELSLQI